MKSRWIKIALVASLALNLVFLGTYLFRKFDNPRHKHKFPTDKSGIIKRLKSDLKVSADQAQSIFEIMRNFRVSIMESKEKILGKRMEIVEALSDPDYTEEDIEEKITQLNEAESEFNRLFVKSIMEVSNLLEPGQRYELLLKVSRPWFFMKGPRERPSNKRRQR